MPRKNVLQVHEHLRPIEAARVDDRIDKCRAVMQGGDVLLTEIALEFPALRLELGHLLARFLRAGPEFRISSAGRVNVPAKTEKKKTRNKDGETSTRKESPVGFQSFGR